MVRRKTREERNGRKVERKRDDEFRINTEVDYCAAIFLTIFRKQRRSRWIKIQISKGSMKLELKLLCD